MDVTFLTISRRKPLQRRLALERQATCRLNDVTTVAVRDRNLSC